MIKIICIGKIKENFYKEAIAEYMKRLSKTEKVFDGNHKSLEKYMRERYYDRYVIKEEDIPESYYELQNDIDVLEAIGQSMEESKGLIKH